MYSISCNLSIKLYNQIWRFPEIRVLDKSSISRWDFPWNQTSSKLGQQLGYPRGYGNPFNNPLTIINHKCEPFLTIINHGFPPMAMETPNNSHLFSVIPIKSPWNHHETTMKSPWNNHEITMKSPWSHHEITMKSQWNHH